jgi:DNA-binding PadR family transcriptional regulator
MKPSSTTYVVLGMLNMAPRSGYEIKHFADSSTRFFWAAGYGQIYPELKRLEDAGLIAGTEAGTGERRRRVYAIEPAGRALLLEWLATPPAVWELRDESLLKLFFVDAVGRDQALEIVAHMRQAARETIARFDAIRPKARRRTTPTPRPRGSRPSSCSTASTSTPGSSRGATRPSGASGPAAPSPTRSRPFPPRSRRRPDMFSLLGRLATRRPRRVVLIAVIGTLLAGASAARSPASWRAAASRIPPPRPWPAREAVGRASGVDPDSSIVALLRPGVDVRSSAGLERVRSVAATLGRDPPWPGC